jgi:hypothetical protein
MRTFLPNVRRCTVVAALFVLATRSAGSFDSADSARSVEVQMQNVLYHYADDVAVHIRKLHGSLLPKQELPIFDDKMSFTLQVASAEIAMSLPSMANVLNHYVFKKSDAPLKDLTLRAAKHGGLVVKGKLHRKGDIPFEGEGQLTTTPDGKILLHLDKMKALHLPVKGLMDLLGVEVSDLVNTGKVTGVRAEKDDLILDPETLLPPPHISGRVTSMRVEGDNMIQVFGSGNAAPIRVSSANYMAYRGHQLRFGKLTMSDTDMILIDMDAKDPFDFYLDHYKEQLVAGYTKETLSFGLRVYMRDYNKLAKAKPGTSAGKAH